MGGLIKHVFWIAPLGVVVLLMTWFLNREGVVDMKTQEAEFSRDWNESMAAFAKSKPLQSQHLHRAAVAQSRYSSALQEQAAKQVQMKNYEQSIDQAVTDLDKQVGGKK